jgi:hypothetical protein
LALEGTSLLGADDDTAHCRTAGNGNLPTSNYVGENRSVKRRTDADVVRIQATIDSDAQHRSGRNCDGNTRLLTTRDWSAVRRSVVLQRLTP